ncbi:MAG: hypothetical protein ABIY47_13235 [Opitutaceae bacterium]
MSQTSNERPVCKMFRPSLKRSFVTVGLALALFFLPQDVPLQYYPLESVGDDPLYLQITCAVDKSGDAQIFYNTSAGINPQESIYWPLSPTEHAYTYTFPLPDAPIGELRLDPVSGGGALIIRQMRIIDRRGTQIQRFTKDQFIPLHEISSISPAPDGWTIVSEPNATDPYARIDLYSPLVAKGLNHRNFLRCLYSWSYLGLMLWILLLAVLFTFYRPRGWKDLVSHVSFMALIALLFSAVGNRGLIKNSFHYSRFVPAATKPGFQLEIDLRIDHPAYAQLFWDRGQGFNESDSVRRDYETHPNLQTLRFPLPAGPLKALRFDPLDGEAQIDLREIRVIDAGNRTRATVPLDSLQFHQDILSHALHRDTMETLEIKTQPGRKDPILMFDSTTITEINRVLQETPTR